MSNQTEARAGDLAPSRLGAIARPWQLLFLKIINLLWPVSLVIALISFIPRFLPAVVRVTVFFGLICTIWFLEWIVYSPLWSQNLFRPRRLRRSQVAIFWAIGIFWVLAVGYITWASYGHPGESAFPGPAETPKWLGFALIFGGLAYAQSCIYRVSPDIPIPFLVSLRRKKKRLPPGEPHAP